MAARAELWVRGCLGMQEVPGEPQTGFAFGKINPGAENPGRGDRLFGNQQIPASSKPVVTSVSPLAHSRGGAGEVRTSLQEHWRARASPAVWTVLGIGLSVVGGNGPWNLLSGSPSAGKTGFRNPTLCLEVSGALGVSVGSIPALPDTPVCSPSAPSLCQQPGRN